MVRLLRSLLLTLAFASTLFTTNTTFAQIASPTATPTPLQPSDDALPATSEASATISAVDTISATTIVTPSVTATVTQVAPLMIPTPTASVTDAASAGVTTAQTATTSVTTTVAPTLTTGPLEGTILANRSDVVARFFLEGETYQLTAGRSQGLTLPRASTVLNLFNCDGELAVDTAGCFWDPYLIQQDGFYEIYDASAQENATAAQPKLMLRQAGAPPTGLVWVQNRTGQTESIVFRDEVHDIAPTAVLEFPVATGVPAILYVRSCLTIDNQSACEWAPKTLDAGVYYAMVEVDSAGAQDGTQRTTIDLRAVVGEDADDAPSEATLGSPTIVCSVVVPALNVRSGPGLQYDIISKVRTTDGSAVTVTVTGRSADNEWLTVDASIAPGGWINNSPSFITCSGDVNTLPVIDAPPPPTPQPASDVQAPPASDAAPTSTGDGQQAPADPAATSTEAGAPSAEGTPASAEQNAAAPTIPDGQALLVINNGFQYQMRFTLDQRYRPQEGPSEYDLQPGQSIAIVVFPGDIPFTASSPWGGLASNASVQAGANQSLTLWLRFELDAGGSWTLRWN